jgi:hypothetical protein
MKCFRWKKLLNIVSNLLGEDHINGIYEYVQPSPSNFRKSEYSYQKRDYNARYLEYHLLNEIG